MTQTLDQRARELLIKHTDTLVKSDGKMYHTVQTSEAVAALTEALTREAEAVAKIGDRDDTIRNLLNERKAYEARIEALEAERNAGGFVGINSVMNEKLRDANETICEQRTRIEELEGALRPFGSEEILHFVDKSPCNVVGLSLFGNAACVSLPTTMGSIRQARATLTQGIKE